MDELTLEGKKYLSSKRAAKITGYAKDYVGQLCREGRVEARLVGRSWYVLEDSLREHRFGKEVSEHTADVLIFNKHSDSETPEEHKEPKIRYTAEATIPLKTATPKRSFLSSEIQYVQKEEQDLKHEIQGISSMQDTWREWFAASPSEKEEKYIEDGSVSIKKGSEYTGKSNEINDKSVGTNKSAPSVQSNEDSEEYSGDAIMRNGEWQEVINYAPLSEEERTPRLSHSVQVKNSLHGYTTIQKASTIRSSHSDSRRHASSAHSQRNRVIGSALVLTALLVGSFAAINFVAANQGYGNTGIFWSGINYIGGTRTFVNKR